MTSTLHSLVLMTTVGNSQMSTLCAPLERDLNWTVFVTISDEVPATGTGTLIIRLEDVNDNPPIIEEYAIRVRLSQIHRSFSKQTLTPSILEILNVILLFPGV